MIGKELAGDTLRLMLKSFIPVYNFGKKRQAPLYLMFDQNWHKMFVNRIKSKTAQTCILKNVTSLFAVENTLF